MVHIARKTLTAALPHIRAMIATDTDELRDVISGWPIGSDYYYSVQIAIDEAQDIAQAVKNWLTGKETS